MRPRGGREDEAACSEGSSDGGDDAASGDRESLRHGVLAFIRPGRADDHVIHAEELLLPWWRAVADPLGDALEVVDPHLHVGLDDPSGFLATPDDVLHGLELIGARGAVFPLKEPHRGYGPANDDVLRLAEEHPDRLVALARIDPGDDPVGMARRCVERGARGIKLHPRGEGFELVDPRLDGVFALAEEHHLVVLVHDGAGVEGLGPQLLARAERHPGIRLVCAHAAACCFNVVVPAVADHPNVYFDTSWWNPGDLWGLLRLVPAGRVLFASDVPFCSPALAATVTARLAIQAGHPDDAQRAILGGQAARLLAGDEPLRHEAAPQPLPVAPELERVAFLLTGVLERMTGGDEPGQGLELAHAACKDGAEAHRVLASAFELLELAEAQSVPDGRRVQRTPGWDLVLLAAIVALTPAAPVPT